MIKKLSFFESLRFNLLYSLPSFLQGLFTRNRFWVSVFTRFQIDRSAVKFMSRLRTKYDTEFFRASVGGADTVVVLDHAAIKYVLANSPFIYGDGQSKHKGMSHFQPNAVTISRGDQWKDRRRFNEAVLNTGHAVHENAGQ